MWDHVIPHFTQFLDELQLTPKERSDAESKADRIARSLWSNYYPGDFNPQCYLKVGSYGKLTATRPSSDLDMLFVLPPSEYWRIDALSGNKQSQLLREVKEVLEATFPLTELRADGQVVVAPFQTYHVEIIPAFQRSDSTYITAHTADGGSWRPSNPVVEYEWITWADSLSSGKATHLTKMLKAWKRECSVELKSISLEVLALDFVSRWQYRDRGLLYYDWLVRDFFEFMLRYGGDGWTLVPGTDEKVDLGNSWLSKCKTAYQRAVKAEAYEHQDAGQAAAEEWKKIFGQQFAPLSQTAPSSMFIRALGAAR